MIKEKGVVFMAVLERLEGYLKENRGAYRVIKHPEVYTAQEIAAAMHVPGKELAKVVMIKAKDRFVMTVMPASFRIDFSKLKEVVHEKDLRLAPERGVEPPFPDCEG